MNGSPKIYTLLESVDTSADVWRCPWEDLANDSSLFGVAMGCDMWVFPDEAFRPFFSPGWKRIDFTKALPDGWIRSEPRAEAVLRRLKRMVRLYALSGFQSLRRTNKKGRDQKDTRNALSMATVVQTGKSLVKLTRFLLETGRGSVVKDDCPDGFALFSVQSKSDWKEIAAVGGKALCESCVRFENLVQDGALTDWLDFPLERAHRSSRLQNATDPLDDALFSKLLRAAMFWSEAGDDLFSLSEWISGSEFVPDAKKKRFRPSQVKALELVSFAGKVLNGGSNLPYKLSNGGTLIGRLSETTAPYLLLNRLFFLVQCSNALLVATATGMRPAELNTLPRNPIRSTALGDVLSGLVFKGQDAFAGQARDWPLPEIARCAIHRQMKLANHFDPKGTGLWFPAPYGQSASHRRSISDAVLTQFTNLYDLDGTPLCAPGDVSIYRIRTSVARLMALSVQGGPLALLTVFGHKDITETMGYYRARGDFEQELSETITAVSRALGETMLAEHQAGVLPARTAKMLQTTLDGLGAAANIPQDGPDLFGSKILVDAAEILGSGAEMVRPGVLCTARGTGQGLCATRTGARDVANCATACPYRFEMAAALDDRRRVAETHLAQIATLAPSEVFRLHFARTGLLAAIQGFEGPLAPYCTDARVLDAVRPLLDTPQTVPSAFSSTLSALFGDRP